MAQRGCRLRGREVRRMPLVSDRQAPIVGVFRGSHSPMRSPRSARRPARGKNRTGSRPVRLPGMRDRSGARNSPARHPGASADPRNAPAHRTPQVCAGSAAIALAVSSIRQENPHSLSYQDITRSIPPSVTRVPPGA